MTETYSYKFNRNDLWKPTDLPTRVLKNLQSLPDQLQVLTVLPEI